MFCFGFPAIGAQSIRADKFYIKNIIYCKIKKHYLERPPQQVSDIGPYLSKQQQRYQHSQLLPYGKPSIGYTKHSC
jgi:hypothetical protein